MNENGVGDHDDGSKGQPHKTNGAMNEVRPGFSVARTVSRLALTCSLARVRLRRLSTGPDDGEHRLKTRTRELIRTIRRVFGVPCASRVYGAPRAPFPRSTRLPVIDTAAPARSPTITNRRRRRPIASSRLPFVYNAITSRGHPQQHTVGALALIPQQSTYGTV